jgi:hypothetical protein
MVVMMVGEGMHPIISKHDYMQLQRIVMHKHVHRVG